MTNTNTPELIEPISLIDAVKNMLDSIRYGTYDKGKAFIELEGAMFRYENTETMTKQLPYAAGEWKPIDTAPRDGTPILALVNDWYSGGKKELLLKPFASDGWQLTDTGDQTFNADDIEGWKITTEAELAKAKAVIAELVGTFIPMLKEIDARGYRNDFTKQYGALQAAHKFILEK